MTQTTVGAHRRAEAPAGGRQMAAAGRVATIDMLRGLALCGILLIHVATFARPGAPPGLGYAGSALDELILAGLILLIEAKFFCLFAMLFGVSFSLQRESAARRGAPFPALFRRRLLILGLIGVAHIVLLWEGDILLLYAAAGLLLIPARDMPPARLVRLALWLLAVPLLAMALAFAALMLARLQPEAAATIAAAEAQFSRDFAASQAAVVARYAGDDQAAAAAGRVAAYLANLPLLLVRAPAVVAMFLLGFAAGRHGVARDVERHLPLLRRASVWGLGVGLLGSALVTAAYTQLPPFAALTALGLNQVFAGPVLAVGYAATFVLLTRRARAGAALAPLAAYGRMALTMYLLQSAICAWLFYGSGLGLVEDVAPRQAIVLALGINAALIAAGVLWLRRFRYGPVEWAWRSLTLGRPQPFLATPPATAREPRPGAAGAAAPTGAPRRGAGFDAPRAPGRR